MNNFIEYFYNMKIDKIIYNDKYYSFLYNNCFILRYYQYLIIVLIVRIAKVDVLDKCLQYSSKKFLSH